MITLDALLLFALAALLLVLTPGPNLLYLISRTLCQGRAAGVVSLAGTSTGFLVHVIAAAFGLSAVFLASSIPRWRCSTWCCFRSSSIPRAAACWCNRCCRAPCRS